MHDHECVPGGSVDQWRLVRGVSFELCHLHGHGCVLNLPGRSLQAGCLYQSVHDDERVPGWPVYQWRLVRGLRL